MSTWKRIAIAGVGARGEYWAKIIAKQFRGKVEIVALCDRNGGRVKRMAGVLGELGQKPAVYRDLHAMLTEAKPEMVLVATPDSDHPDTASAAMRMGADVMLEKPIGCTADGCRTILSTKRDTGRRCVVGFNARWAPTFTQLKDIIQSGAIGETVSADMQWLLDTSHGADYFRRWHRRLANSGGLLVHKSTHHFDLVNWLLNSTPTAVFARGSRRFYRPETAHQMGLTDRGERCMDCRAAARCPYRLDLKANDYLRDVYLANEQLDGYQRDRCIFSSDIDIPDSASISARYASGAMLTYSLQAYSPWEGVLLNIDGTRGRLEYAMRGEQTTVRLHQLGKPAQDLEPWIGEGSHGGGDERLAEALFAETRVEDKWGRLADERAGAWSALVGIAANASIAQGREIRISELCPELQVDGTAAIARAN